MKVITTTELGYRPHSIDNFFSSLRMTSTISRKREPLSGVCFQILNHSKDTDWIEDFGHDVWSNGVMTFEVPDMSAAAWRDFEGLILDGYAVSHKLSFFMHLMDQADVAEQCRLAEMMEIEGSHSWLISVQDHRKLIPELLRQLCVYLGTDERDCMQFLAQEEHTIQVDSN